MFGLPNLGNLCLDGAPIEAVSSLFEPYRWSKVKSHSVKSLSLPNLTFCWSYERDVSHKNLLFMFSKIFTQLQVLHITTANPKHLSIALSAFREHVPKLRRLEAYSQPFKTSRPIVENRDGPEDFSGPENMQAIRAAPGLRYLCLDTVDPG